MYATLDDMRLRFGDVTLTQLTCIARQGATEPDADVIGAALADATELIDGYAAARYVTPLSPVPAPVRRWCMDIAVYYLHGSGAGVPDDVRQAYEDAMSGLKDMGKGVIVFQSAGLPSEEKSASNGIRLEAPERVFTADSLKGF